MFRPFGQNENQNDFGMGWNIFKTKILNNWNISLWLFGSERRGITMLVAI
jgi:hypothetical protein